MARDLITPYKCTENSTAAVKLTSGRMVKISSANGAYIKTGGASQIDATRLIFVVTRSSKKAATGYITVKSNSTGSAEGFEGIRATTYRDLKISLDYSTVINRDYPQFFVISETARYKDSNGYINFEFSTAMTSNGGGGTSGRGQMGAIYIKPV